MSDIPETHPIRAFVIETGSLKDGFQKACEHIAALEADNEALRNKLTRQLYIVWEGDESEGRWRCLMCGDKREGEDDTGPERIQHIFNCGEVGSTVWAFDRMEALRNQIERAMEAMGLTWSDLEGFGGAVEGICDTIEALCKRVEALERIQKTAKALVFYDWKPPFDHELIVALADYDAFVAEEQTSEEFATMHREFEEQVWDAGEQA